MATRFPTVHNCAELIDLINEIGFLPLLRIGDEGWSAEEVVDDDCRYVVRPDGGWDWPLWDWKGDIIRDSGCAYGKFFLGKAGFVSRQWWPDFCNMRRSHYPRPEAGSIDEAVLFALGENGSMITRDLRSVCGFTGPKMRSRFDARIARLQMGCRIVTEDFVYPKDRHGNDYGWGLALLTTPEALFGHAACHPDLSPEESEERVRTQMGKLLPDISGRTMDRLLGTKTV